MIIDCHGHYTTVPKPLRDWRQRQIDSLKDSSRAPQAPPVISEDEIRESLEGAQLQSMRDRGVDLTIFSPIAGQMGHHIGKRETSERWSAVANEVIHRVCTLYPEKFVGVCQLPQSPGVAPANCIPELERCVKEYGFIGCNLNPDPSGGYWTDPPLTDKWWYPLYEKMVELDVPAMVHVSGSCNPNFHHTGAHYINGDTTAFMQFLVYHRPGIELLLKVIPSDNILFAQEIFGAVRGVDPETGYNYDDTKRYIDAIEWLEPTDREKIFEKNVGKVYPRFDARKKNRA